MYPCGSPPGPFLPGQNELNLLIDSGNSRIKWGWQHQQKLVERGAVAWAAAQSVVQQWHNRPAPQHIFLSNSAGERRFQQLQCWLVEVWGMEAEEVKTGVVCRGLHNGYRQPQQLGIDRWLGMVAAWEQLHTAFCLVDCGTAVTIDYVDRSGHHRGGNILPGFGSTMETLLQNAPHLRQSDRVGGELLGTATAQALMSQSVEEPGVVEVLLQQIEQQQGAFELILTGGDAAALQQQLGLPFRIVEDLILQGLALVTMP